MKWKEWGEEHWVLVNDEGEVVDEIRRDSSHFFVLQSSKKKYVSLKDAKASRQTGTPAVQ